MSAPDTPFAVAAPDPVRARAARLEARLAVYAQYAAVVAEQAAATLAGDQPRVDALTEERLRVAEHFDELRPPAGGPLASAASFRSALDDALAELAHQGAVDSALGARLAVLREAVVRGAAWGEGEAPYEPSPRQHDPVPYADPVHAALGGALGGALVAARAAGVGGALGGQYPGRIGRDEYPAGWLADGVAPVAGVADAPQVDIRF